MIVYFLSRAEKDLRKLPKLDQIAVSTKIKSFVNQIVANEEKLVSYSNAYRVRVGKYRIIYRKSKTSRDIVIIAHRKDVYRFVGELLR